MLNIQRKISLIIFVDFSSASLPLLLLLPLPLFCSSLSSSSVSFVWHTTPGLYCTSISEFIMARMGGGRMQWENQSSAVTLHPPPPEIILAGENLIRIIFYLIYLFSNKPSSIDNHFEVWWRNCWLACVVGELVTTTLCAVKFV